MESTKPVAETAYRQFLADFAPDHLHDIVLALHEHAQATARAMLCADLESGHYLSDPSSTRSVDALARLLYVQALEWDDEPTAALLADYVHPYVVGR